MILTVKPAPKITTIVRGIGQPGPQGPAGSDATATTDASLLVLGTLADARLSANVALENVANVFTANQQINGALGVTGNITLASGVVITSGSLGVGTLTINNDGNSRWQFNGSEFIVAGNIRPSTNNARNIGDTSFRWANVFGVNGNFSGTVNGSVFVPPASMTSLGVNCFISGNVSLANTTNLRFSSTADPNGVSDAGIIRGGSSLIDVLATNGVRFRNGNNTADAPVSCGNLTASGNAILRTVSVSGEAAFSGFGVNRNSATGAIFNAYPALQVTAKSSFQGIEKYTSAGALLGVVYVLGDAGGVNVGIGVASNDIAPELGITRKDSNTWQLNNGTLGTLRDAELRNLAATGTVTGGLASTPVTFAVLNATTATATLGLRRLTDRSSRIAYPDGTNWRFVSDDAIIS